MIDILTNKVDKLRGDKGSNTLEENQIGREKVGKGCAEFGGILLLCVFVFEVPF